ncbi:hypothetical protein GCM10009676_06750 [Prauserella halophila]|uniref:Uncharacterized protein n=1 Tax=Prauserella halophila TaxID=185641 RepID=A0ABN1W1M9_9PSEU|nr:hypothetical protein [Prauserella halophila]MCP2237274.1 hypothetical protein [Prauserella halophila]
MTTLDLSVPNTEFPTLDLDLDQAPLAPALYLSTFEARDWPAALAVALPDVVYAARTTGRSCAQHEFIDTATFAAVRLVLTYDVHDRQVVAAVAEAGTGGLWDRIVAAATDWNQAGRPPAEVWSPR